MNIARGVSTRFRHRSSSLAPIAQLIAAQCEAAPGNYIAFFSRFDYLEQAAGELSARHPRIPTWRQGRRMDEAERETFLERFAVDGCGVGFAVLGGSFAEGSWQTSRSARPLENFAMRMPRQLRLDALSPFGHPNATFAIANRRPRLASQLRPI